MEQVFRLFLMLLLMVSALGQAEPASGFSPGYRQGYLLEVDDEKYENYDDLFLSPTFNTNPVGSGAIFTEPLSKEFQQKYREKFGQLDTESIVYQNPRISNYETGRKYFATQEKENAERRQYAEYVTKRLAEWHVDNYFKTEPNMRPVYEAKEKLSNIQVEVAQDVRLDLKYSLAGNTLDILVVNPFFLESKLAVEMDPKSFGPGNVQETRLWLKSQVNKRLRWDNNLAVSDGIATSEIVQSWKNLWTSSIGISGYFKPLGASTRETRMTVGLGRSY